MIDVDQIFRQVVNLSRKGQTGDYTGSDFNLQQSLVQSMLFDWYFARYEKDQKVPDSLRPFISEPLLPIIDGEVTLPSDYRHRVEVQVGYVIAGPTITYYPCPHVAGNAEIETRISYVRRPSSARRRFYHTIKASTLKILPTDFTGHVRLKYLAQPADAVWGSTLDTDNDVENYDSASSTNFLWEPQDEQNLVDLFLYLKGIQTRQSELLEWVAQKNILAKQ